MIFLLIPIFHTKCNSLHINYCHFLSLFTSPEHTLKCFQISNKYHQNTNHSAVILYLWHKQGPITVVMKHEHHIANLSGPIRRYNITRGENNECYLMKCQA
jgi:hypothetical protein